MNSRIIAKGYIDGILSSEELFKDGKLIEGENYIDGSFFQYGKFKDSDFVLGKNYKDGMVSKNGTLNNHKLIHGNAYNFNVFKIKAYKVFDIIKTFCLEHSTIKTDTGLYFTSEEIKVAFRRAYDEMMKQ